MARFATAPSGHPSFLAMNLAGQPERLVSRAFSCSSLLGAVDSMDATSLLQALPDDPAQIAAIIQETRVMLKEPANL